MAPIEIFCCYAREDQSLLEKLRTHLSSLKRQGLVTLWANTDIRAGAEWEEEIQKHLNTAQIILLLISPDFMASDYCYSEEMQRALERHDRREAWVIPIILRPTYRQVPVLSRLKALPRNDKPITMWSDKDAAFSDIVEDIQRVVEELLPLSTKTDSLLEPDFLLPPYSSQYQNKEGMENTNSNKRDFSQQTSLQAQNQEEDHWIELRWFILISSILTIVLLTVGFFLHTQTIISTIIILALISLTLALIQSFHLNQWYWFTGILVLGPVVWIAYGLLNPPLKVNRRSPPKQLILIMFLLGIILVIAGLSIFLNPSGVQNAYGLLGIDLIMSSYILSLIRAILLKQWDWLVGLVILTLFAAPIYALFGPTEEQDRFFS